MKMIYFSKEIGLKYDVPTAIVLHHFHYWYNRVKKEDHQYFEGEYWVRMKIERIQTYIPMYSVPQLRRFVNKMVANDLLKSSEFNIHSNDRTKWYTLTEKAKKLLGVVAKNEQDLKQTDLAKYKKETANKLTNKTVNGSNKTVSCIYKEEDSIKKYKYIVEKIEKNRYLLSLLSNDHHLPIDVVKGQIERFMMFCISVSEPTHANDRDLFTHFSRWFRKQNIQTIDCERQLDWFIGKFNEVSRREFVITEKIRELFAMQLANGFTGKQMLAAIINLYSSSEKNEFHVRSGFKFATPNYLLKEGNLNKYMNLKY